VNCPRCQSKKDTHRVEHQGRDGDRIVWTVRYCTACAFTWRDSEPAESIDYETRDAWFRVDASRPDSYPYNIPPAKELS
jgi:C4-type Zn-finger protein